MSVSFDDMINEALDSGISEEDIAKTVSEVLNRRKKKVEDKDKYLRQLRDRALKVVGTDKMDLCSAVDLTFVQLVQLDKNKNKFETEDEYREFREFLWDWIDNAVDSWVVGEKVKDMFDYREDDNGWRLSFEADKDKMDKLMKIFGI